MFDRINASAWLPRQLEGVWVPYFLLGTGATLVLLGTLHFPSEEDGGGPCS